MLHIKENTKIKISKLLLCIILLITVIGSLLNIQRGHNWGDDFSLYIHQAKSIVQGHISALAAMNKAIVEESSEHTFSPTLYPWGFPLILTPFYALFGLNYTAFKLLEIAFFTGALFMLYQLVRRTNKLNIPASLFLIALVGFDIFYLGYPNNVLSELPFLFFSLGTLFLLTSYDGSPQRKTYRTQAIIGFLLFFTFCIRTEGIGLFLALFAVQIQYSIIHRKGIKFNYAQIAVFLLPYVTALILYTILQQFLPTGFTSHLSYRHLVNGEVTMDNLSFYFNGLGFVSGNFLPTFWFGIFLIFSCIGIIIRVQKDLPMVIFLFFLIILFSIWPFHEYRYLISIYPLLLYFFLQSFLSLLNNYQDNKTRVIPYIFFSIMLYPIVASSVSNTQAAFNNVQIIDGPETKESQEMFAYIKEHTSLNDVIIFFRPRAMNLYTDRKSLAVFDGMENVRAKGDYYVMNKDIGSFFQILIQPENISVFPFLQMVYSNNQFVIYKIKK